MIGIYKITSPTKKVYIGQSVDVRRRIRDHKGAKRSGTPILARSFKKYGIENHKFEVVTECTVDELNSLERYYQELYHCIGKNGLNCSLVATNKRRAVYTEENREKRLLAAKKATETKIRRGVPFFSEVAKEKIKEYFKHAPKKILTSEQIENLRQFSIGRIVSEETRRKLSLAHKGRPTGSRPKPPGFGKRVSERLKGKFGEESPSSKIILNTETGIYYYGSEAAAASTNMRGHKYLSRMLAGTKLNKTPFMRV